MAGKTVGNEFAGKVKTLSSIPFEEDYELDRGPHSFPVAQVALGAGASLLAVWISPLIMALSAMPSVRRVGARDPVPDTGTVHQPTAFPSVRAA